MATSDMQKILGALLGGAQRGGIRPTRRRRSPAPLVDVRIGGSRSATAALATLAGAVLGTIFSGGGGGGAPAPATPRPGPTRPGPMQGRAGRPQPVDVGPAAPRPPTGASQQAPLPNPWSSRPAAPTPPSPPSALPSADTNAEDAEALLILRAMISCAKADGKLDQEERTAIAGQLDQAGLDQAARDLVLAEFASPAAVAEIARAVRDPVLAAQVYAAAYLAAGEIGAAERGWLDEFARAAGLDPRAAAAIEAKLSGG